MFGIGLPEFILIMALALIVVGPDKLPDLARSVAKGILELKKTANTLKESLTENGNPLDEIKPELEEAARSIKDQVLDVNSQTWRDSDSAKTDDAYARSEATSPVIDVDTAEESPAPAEHAPSTDGDGLDQENDSAVTEIKKSSAASE